MSAARRRSRRPTSSPACATASAHHRAGDGRGAGPARAGRPPDRPDRHVPAPVFELGAEANVLDPIWQVMPRPPGRRCRGPTHRRHRLPAAEHRARARRGRRPLGRHRHQLRRVPLRLRPHLGRRAASRRPPAGRSTRGGARSTTRSSPSCGPASPAADLTAAAIEVCGGEQPWMPHFYLGHGLGLDSAEAPYVGTDLGEASTRRWSSPPGMVLVLEPIVWDDGHSGLPGREVFAHHRGRLVNHDRLPVRPVLMAT